MQLDLNPETWLKLGAGAGAVLWSNTPPVLQLLLILMAIDILTGLLAAIAHREVSSGEAFRGLSKKAIILLLVGAGVALEPYTGLPAGDAIAGFYAAHELISVAENAARAGLPVPEVVKAALLKLNPESTTAPPPGENHGQKK